MKCFFLTFYFLENELCEIQEFFFDGGFGPLFFFFFFLTTKKKAKNWAQPIGLCVKSEFTYLWARVFETNLFFFLALLSSIFSLQETTCESKNPGGTHILRHVYRDVPF